MVSENWIAVEVVCAEPSAPILLSLQAPPGSSVEEVLALPEVREAFPGLNPENFALSIFGRRVQLSTIVAAGERIELCLPIRIDPKQARRKRTKT